MGLFFLTFKYQAVVSRQYRFCGSKAWEVCPVLGKVGGSIIMRSIVCHVSNPDVVAADFSCSLQSLQITEVSRMLLHAQAINYKMNQLAALFFYKLY